MALDGPTLLGLAALITAGTGAIGTLVLLFKTGKIHRLVNSNFSDVKGLADASNTIAVNANAALIESNRRLQQALELNATAAATAALEAAALRLERAEERSAAQGERAGMRDAAQGERADVRAALAVPPPAPQPAGPADGMGKT
jgi:hypothetical protein